jgi:hypothetical protein
MMGKLRNMIIGAVAATIMILVVAATVGVLEVYDLKVGRKIIFSDNTTQTTSAKTIDTTSVSHRIDLINAQYVTANLSTTISFAKKLTNYDRDTVVTKTLTPSATGAVVGNCAMWTVYGGTTSFRGFKGDTTDLVSTGKYSQVTFMYDGHFYWVARKTE